MPAVQPGPGQGMQRRHSSASSSDTSSEHGQTSRHTSQENISLIPTRTTKVATSKPAANPLKFVKVGPCDLSRYAQEQLKKVEEVKKVKPEKRDEAEDWQSNLDNWKCSRRKRQEHIIERVVEVKKLELEEHDRNRRRSKTFSEMLEERNSKGRKTSLPVFQDDDNDLSDLGLSTSKTNGDDNVFLEKKDSTSSSDEASSACNSSANGENKSAVNGHSQQDQQEPSSEQEEYTYERAIQNYVNFTESRGRAQSVTPSDSDSSKCTNGFTKKSSPPIPTKPRRGSCKIEEKLSELEQMKKKSMSTNDLTDNNRRSLSVPKVDILKRREMFEKGQEEETQSVKNRLSGDFGSTKSIRDRVSSLGRPSDELQSVKKVNRLSAEISVKDRLLNIEKQNSVDNNSQRKSNTSLNDNAAISQSVKDRLSSLQKSSESKQMASQNQATEKIEIKETPSRKTSIKENLSVIKLGSNDITDNKSRRDTEIRPGNIHKEDVQKEEEIVNEPDSREQSVLSPSEEMYESKRQQHYRHRSLDSLDVDSNDGVGNESFERVQSLEDLDFCRNYPASSVSGDTDREDSGIHTADVSSSVSQADDCDLHLDGCCDPQPTILEEINKNPELIKQISQISVSDCDFDHPVEPAGLEVVDNSCGFLKLPLKLDCDPLPVILESPSEPFPQNSFLDFSTTKTPIAPNSSPETTPSHNVTTNAASDSKSVNSDIVNINSKTESEQCTLTSGDGDATVTSLVNKTKPSLSTLPPVLLHDIGSGAVEICQKIELGDLSSPLTKPEVTVEAEYKFEPEEKFEDSLEYKAAVRGAKERHLTALTIDVSSKRESTSNNVPDLAVFNNTDSSKLLEGIEVVFPLSPSTLEPPKEKPPPPPTEISDDDESANTKNKTVSLRRLDSTKRIKKEIRQKRSSFLGIEGANDDNYLEPELELVRRPPDINSFLAEEKRLEQLLYRQSVCSESESRDSGVELEKHTDDLTWPPTHHSRDNSEIYANTSTTSEEEEIMKKEREIIEMLEREEINRYSLSSQDQENLGEKLAVRLRELEAEKARLEWEREEEMSRRKAEEAVRVEQQTRIQERERELCKQENAQDVQEVQIDTEMLLAERERLEAEQASLARQRDLMLQQQYSHGHNRSLTDVRASEPSNAYHRSMQDLRQPEPVMRRPVEPPPLDNRRSMPDLAQPRRPPPPIPPAKPLVIPRQERPLPTQDKRLSSPQQMTRQTLQALAAAPRPRLNDNWLPNNARRKPKDNCNYQHWLIQEAEQRRITEHHQRQAPPPRRPVPPPPQPNGGWVGGNVSSGAGQYSNWQPVGGQWGPPAPSPAPALSSTRSDKPLPDSIIQTLTQRVQNRLNTNAVADPNNNRRRAEHSPVIEQRTPTTVPSENQEKMLSVSGKKKCSHCGDELGRGAAMIIESLRLFYHIDCFKCCVCCVQLGDGLMGTDVRVRNNKLHCHNCYSSDDGVKFSCV